MNAITLLVLWAVVCWGGLFIWWVRIERMKQKGYDEATARLEYHSHAAYLRMVEKAGRRPLTQADRDYLEAYDRDN